MGDKVETPEYIINNNLIDYTHYITNQLMKPIQQLDCVLEDLWLMQNKKSTIKTYKKEIIKKLENENPDMEVFEKEGEVLCK